MTHPILPAGASPPIGFTLAEDPERPPALLADNIDVQTGEILSLFKAPHHVDAAVQFQARARRGSGVAIELAGHRIDSIDQARPSARAEAIAEAKSMVAGLVAAGHIEVSALKAQIEPNGAPNFGAVQIVYRNLRKGDGEAKTVRT